MEVVAWPDILITRRLVHQGGNADAGETPDKNFALIRDMKLALREKSTTPGREYSLTEVMEDGGLETVPDVSAPEGEEFDGRSQRGQMLRK